MSNRLQLLLYSPACCFIGYLWNSYKLACLASEPNTCYYRHTCLNCCQTINWPDNSGYHMHLRFQNQQSLYILDHVPFLQLLPRCGFLLNLTFGLLPHLPPSNPAKDCTLLCHLYVHGTVSCQGAPPTYMRPWTLSLCKFLLHCIVAYRSTTFNGLFSITTWISQHQKG